MSLRKRVAALEAHAAGDTSDTSASAERFRVKFTELMDRMEGRDPDPATMSHIEQMACLMHTDPAAAIAEIKAAAQRALSRAHAS